MSGNVIAVFLSGLLAALISAGVTVAGWRVVKQRQERDEDLRLVQRQMEELYGPLRGLLYQQQTAYNIVTQLVPTKANGHPDIPSFSPEEKTTWDFCANTYMIPIQRQMRELMFAKIHLLTSTELPASFVKFIANTTQFEYLHRLASEPQVHTLDKVDAKEWPTTFGSDVDETLAELKTQYDQLHQGRSRGAMLGQPRRGDAPSEVSS